MFIITIDSVFCVDQQLKALNDAKGKFPYKSAADVDNQIKALDKQVESGTLKLVDERKILNEISTFVICSFSCSLG